MNHATPLDTLIDLTQERVEKAGETLAQLGTQRRDAQGQLQTLDAYRADYTEQLQNTTSGGVSASNYHNFRQFIATLDEAISQQNRLIAQIDTRLEAGRRHWQDEKRRLSSYETLKARKDRQLQYQEQRREQRASDETAASLFRRSQQSH